MRWRFAQAEIALANSDTLQAEAYFGGLEEAVEVQTLRNISRIFSGGKIDDRRSVTNGRFLRFHHQ
jgi:hypothetical protein